VQHVRHDEANPGSIYCIVGLGPLVQALRLQGNNDWAISHSSCPLYCLALAVACKGDSVEAERVLTTLESLRRPALPSLPEYTEPVDEISAWDPVWVPMHQVNGLTGPTYFRRALELRRVSSGGLIGRPVR